MTACREGHHLCVTVLVNAGCNVDAVDNDGRTALMYAVNFGQLKCVRELQRATTGVDTGVRAINEAKGIDEVALDLLKDDGGDEATKKANTIRRPLGRACAHCERLKKNMFKCAKCESVYYCSPECQRAHWPTHERECGDEDDTDAAEACGSGDVPLRSAEDQDKNDADFCRLYLPI
jgi:hypothetical protein